MAGSKEGTPLHTIYYQRMVTRGRGAFVASDAEARKRLLEEDNVLYFGAQSTFFHDRDLVWKFLF